MKILFEKHLCPREFGSAVFNVPDLMKWAQEKGFYLPTALPLGDYDFAQAENVLSLIANFPHHNSTTDEAVAHVATNPTLAQHPSAEVAPAWLAGADAGEQWRKILSQAIANGELVLFDRYSLLPVVTADAPAAKVKAGTSPSGDAWKANAWQIGKKILEEKPLLNVDKIAEKTHHEMTRRKAIGELGMTGRGGKVPCADTIKRHALTGIKS